MKIGTAGLNLVKKFEGCRLTAYKCPAGVWTIGYGHTGSVDGKAIRSGMTITDAKATELLREDIEKFEKAVENCAALSFTPNQNQFDALVSFAFNCGAGNLKKLVEGRTAEVVAEKLLLYNKANGQVLRGLVNRRKAERELFLTPAVQPTPSYTVGNTYTLQTELKVRTGAGTNYSAKKHSQLTADGKKHDKDGDGALEKGTKVTCKEIKHVGNDIWMRTPSGWLAAYYNGNVYIK